MVKDINPTWSPSREKSILRPNRLCVETRPATNRSSRRRIARHAINVTVGSASFPFYPMAAGNGHDLPTQTRPSIRLTDDERPGMNRLQFAAFRTVLGTFEGHGGTAEVPEELRDLAVKMGFEVRMRDGREGAWGNWPGWVGGWVFSRAPAFRPGAGSGRVSRLDSPSTRTTCTSSTRPADCTSGTRRPRSR